MNSSDYRQAKLLKLAGTLQRLNWPILATVLFLPVVTIGTGFHDRAVSIGRYSGLTALVMPFYIWWVRAVYQWVEKTGRDPDGFWPGPCIILGTLPGIIAVYPAIRLFDHDGNWNATIAITWDSLVLAVIFSTIGVCTIGAMITSYRYYQRGENIIFKNGKPAKPWHVVAHGFFIPSLALVIATIAYLFRADTTCTSYLIDYCLPK